MSPFRPHTNPCQNPHKSDIMVLSLAFLSKQFMKMYFWILKEKWNCALINNNCFLMHHSCRGKKRINISRFPRTFLKNINQRQKVGVGFSGKASFYLKITWLLIDIARCTGVMKFRHLVKLPDKVWKQTELTVLFFFSFKLFLFSLTHIIYFLHSSSN